MGRILQDIYRDASIAPVLGFKGGTCAYFFYQLPRCSVDLDFDLLETDDSKTQTLVFDAVKTIFEKYGVIKDARIKRYTIFCVLSYGDEDHNIKFEANTRLLLPEIKTHYEIKESLGISMLVAKQPYLFAGKLAALTQRKKTAMRDIYDIWFFAKNNWDIDTEALKTLTEKTIQEQFADSIALIERVKDDQILQGLGELLGEKEKIWVKNHLREEVVLLLKNYQSVLK